MVGTAYRWFERPIRWGIVGGVWAWESSRGSSLGLGVLLWELGRGGSGSEAGLWGLGGGYDAQSRPLAVPTPRWNSLLFGQYWVFAVSTHRIQDVDAGFLAGQLDVEQERVVRRFLQ